MEYGVEISRLLLTCVVSGMLLAGPRTALAEIKVLFIGNSFTMGDGDTTDRSQAAGGVPGIFDRLAQAGGQGNPTTLMSSAGGTDFKYHSQNASTQSAIKSQLWDYVVLQNYSTEPTHLMDGTHSLSNHFTYGAHLAEQIRNHHPQARILLFQTWSRAAAHALIKGVSSSSGFASTTEFQAELRTNYHKLAEMLNASSSQGPAVQVAPVGDAWQKAGGLLPASDPNFVDLFKSDNYHGNDNGYYLTAAVFYGWIYRASPLGLSSNALVAGLKLNLTVSPSVLEEAAWETVAATLPPEVQTPIVFTLQPASQSVIEFRPATFRASVEGSPPYFIQWLRNGQPIAGANQFAYSIPSVTAELDGSQFSMMVSNLAFTATSSNAMLQVLEDNVLPEIVSAEVRGRIFEISFSEILEVSSATNVSHYAVAGRQVQVTGATLSADGKTVSLILDRPFSGQITVTVGPVSDLAGNLLAAGSAVTAVAPAEETLALYFDFGAAAATTQNGPFPDDPARYWNNISTTVGGSATGQLRNLITANNTPSGIDLVMINRFNGANENGTLTSDLYPGDATRDSLYGNTETFNGLASIFPSFKLTGLDAALLYQFTFYASRTGVSDNRESGYTVTGANSGYATLNAANNLTNTARVSGIRPNAAGVIAISLAPTSRNNNANHFTYLGVMIMQPAVPPYFQSAQARNGKIVLRWGGEGKVERSASLLGPWAKVEAGSVSPYEESIISGENRFYRLILDP